MMDDQKPNPQQHKLIMFSCPVSVLVSQTKSQNHIMNLRALLRKSQFYLWQTLNIPSNECAFNVQKRQLFLEIFREINNFLRYLSIINPFNFFYYKGFRKYSYKPVIGYLNCIKKL